MGIQCLKMPNARRGADLNADVADGINHAEPDYVLSTVSTELTKERKVPKERKRCDYYFSSKDLTSRLRTTPYPKWPRFPYPLHFIWNFS